MRTLKLCTILGVVAALAVPAGAIPVLFETENREQGNLFNVTSSTDGTYLRVDNGADPLGWYLGGDTTAESLPVFSGGNTWAGEDNWGLIWLNKIEIPWYSGNDVYVKPTNSGGTALIGMFYGSTDESVGVYTDGFGNKQYTILAGNLEFKVWQVAISSNIQTLYSTLGDIGTSVGQRTAQDAYNGWTNLPGATLVLEGGLLNAKDEFNFTSSQGAGGFGTSNLYASLDPTSPAIWNQFWDTNMINPDVGPAPLGPPAATNSDVYMNWTVGGIFDNGSLVSTDFGYANVVPEPLTMLTLFGSIGLLGGYIRKRRAS